jgi:ABC-2 type transport system ATP-binding protein
MSPYISAEGLTKVYGSVTAVDDISFSIDEKSIFGFLGPNGAGKTTTLRMMCGVLDPTSGRCSVGGYDTISKKIDVKSITGYLPEEDFLYGDMRVWDHLDYMAQLYGVPKRKKAVEDALNLVDIASKAQERVSTLSKGQRRRVAIAKTLIHDPQVVLLDEVTSGLDPVYSKKMIELVATLRKLGKTVVFSTHLLDEATKLCDKILIINKGRIMALGTVKEIKKQTQTKSLEHAFFKIMS